MLDTILNERLKKEVKDKINMNQTGFRAGIGYEVNIMRITNQIKTYKKDNSKKTWSLFIDLKSAFDSVNHNILFDRMRKMKINEELINTIEWLYQQTEFAVGNERIKIGAGVI